MHEIRQLLGLYPPDCQPSRIEPLGSAGGMSGAQFWRITARRDLLVLRRWPTEHPTPDRLRFIHAVLQHAVQRGVAFLPAPIPTRDCRSFVEHDGHLWELAPWMPGTADYEQSPSVEKLRAAMTALAGFHFAMLDFIDFSKAAATYPNIGAPPAIKGRLARLQELTSKRTAELSGAINDNIWPDLAPIAHQFMQVLSVAIPRAISKLESLANAPLWLQPCIRDIWHDHVLFTGDGVTGFIDFGAVDIDTRATDVARLLGSLVGDDALGWQIGLAAYCELQNLSPQELLAVRALDASGTILAGINWIRWIYIEGREFENQIQVTERFQRILDRTRFTS
jgi:homoserine kinase type II